MVVLSRSRFFFLFRLELVTKKKIFSEFLTKVNLYTSRLEWLIDTYQGPRFGTYL